MIHYYTRPEYGNSPRRGLSTLVDLRISDGSFGYRFPAECPDGHGPCGCDAHAFGHMINAEVPQIDWHHSQNSLPHTAVILDSLEFCAPAVGEPRDGTDHSFLGRNHLSWDRDKGSARFVTDVNQLFARNGIAYKLTDAGHSKTTQATLTSLDQIDYLFGRLFTFIRMILKATNRGG